VPKLKYARLQIFTAVNITVVLTAQKLTWNHIYALCFYVLGLFHFSLSDKWWNQYTTTKWRFSSNAENKHIPISEIEVGRYII